MCHIFSAPSAAANISLSPVNSTCMGVTWIGPARGPVTEFVITYTGDHEDSATKNVSVHVNSRNANGTFQYLLCGLTPGDLYNVTVASRTEGGTSDFISDVARLRKSVLGVPRLSSKTKCLVYKIYLVSCIQSMLKFNAAKWPKFERQCLKYYTRIRQKIHKQYLAV